MKGKLGGVFFLPLGMSLTFLFLFFFRRHFLDLDFSLGYEGKLGVVFFFAIGNVINVPFSFFSLGDASWTWISAWAMKVSWGWCFFLPLGMSLTFLFLFFL